MAPVILDATGSRPELAEICCVAFEEWNRMLEGGLRRGRHRQARAHALAVLVNAAIKGLLLTARADCDCAALAIVGAELERIIADAIPKDRRRRA